MLDISMSAEATDPIIEMAWEDRTPFDAIHFQFGFTEEQVVRLMRQEMKSSSYKLWRERVYGLRTKHTKLNCCSASLACTGLYICAGNLSCHQEL